MLSKIYHHPWCPRFFFKKYDGGKDSSLTTCHLIMIQRWRLIFLRTGLSVESSDRRNFSRRDESTVKIRAVAKATG